MPSMSPRAFAARYLGPATETADGVRTDCPACHTAGAFVLTATAHGGSAYCTGRPDTESPCHSVDFAASLGMAVEDFDALLDDVRSTHRASSVRDLVIGRSALGRLPVLEPLISDTVLRRTLTFVAGPPASGKSFHLLAWAACVATGTPWMDRTVAKGRVLYLIAEGAYGVHDRLAAWEAYHDVTIDDAAFHAVPVAVQFSDDGALADLCSLISEEDYDLVVVDTLSRSAVGLDESSAADMSRFVAALDRLREAMTNGAVVVAHHSSKGGQALRGSSVIEGAADTVYVSDHPGEDGPYPFRLRRMKNKYGPEEDRLNFVWSSDDASGSGILAAPESAARPADRDEVDGVRRTWRAILDAFGTGAQTFTRTEAAHAAMGLEVSRTSAYRHVSELIDRGAVVVVTTGRGSTGDRFTIDLRAATRHGLDTDRWAPLEGSSEHFLDGV